MISRIDVNLYNLITSISNAVDLVNPVLSGHHIRVAYIAGSLGRSCNLERSRETHLILAGALHDMGAITVEERFEALEFELHHPQRHAELGYQLLKRFDSFAPLAEIVRFHHTQWRDGRGLRERGKDVPWESHLLHLADRIDVLIKPNVPILSQRNEIVRTIQEHVGTWFAPRAVEAFTKLARREHFWLDVVSPGLSGILADHLKQACLVEWTMERILQFSWLMAQIVDFRSRFTSTHSSGVAATAEYLARLNGFSQHECQKIMVAGFLHDIGKLAVPGEILDKPGRLTQDEYDIIKTHPYYTARILKPISGFEDVIDWCVFHHERLDGEGYPFREVGMQIPLGARLVAVADVFTALTEDRPYRDGLPEERVKEILKAHVEGGALDGRVVQLLMDNYEDINRFRSLSQNDAVMKYEDISARMDLFTQESAQEQPDAPFISIQTDSTQDGSTGK